MTTTTTPTFSKEISYDRETGDFRATLDGNYIGHFASYYEAECALDQVAYDLLMDGQCATATELDGGSEPDAMVADHAVVAPVCATCGACPDCDPIDEYADEYVPFEPFPVDALLDEADAAFEAYIQRLAEDAGLACSFCGEAHDAAECPLRRPLVVPSPRVCGCCGGAHSIQRCGELRAALFSEAA